MFTSEAFVDGGRKKDQWSPKAGLTIYPHEQWTIRGAYFQDLGISNESDIGSIEPTLVGGFNQVFGDLPGAETETFGVGADWNVVDCTEHSDNSKH